MLTVEIHTRELEQTSKRFSQALEMNSIKLMKNIRTQLVKAQRLRFTTANDGKWRSLAPLTEKKTGRTKPLQGQERYVFGQHDKDSARVLFKNHKDWTIDQHDQGFTSPAVNDKFMSVKFFGRGGVSFKDREASRIPARPIWLEQDKAGNIVAKALAAWTKKELK